MRPRGRGRSGAPLTGLRSNYSRKPAVQKPRLLKCNGVILPRFVIMHQYFKCPFNLGHILKQLPTLGACKSALNEPPNESGEAIFGDAIGFVFLYFYVVGGPCTFEINKKLQVDPGGLSTRSPPPRHLPTGAQRCQLRPPLGTCSDLCAGSGLHQG